MSSYPRHNPYNPNPTLCNVQEGSVLSLWKHNGMERLMCNFAGTYCETNCVFEDAGYEHPATVIKIHGKAEQDDHRMLFVTFISMTTHPKEHFKTLPIGRYTNGKTKPRKGSFWVLPHTYTLPLYRFRPFIVEAGSTSIVPTDNPPLKGNWLHCDTDSSNWLELAIVNELIRNSKDISIAANYPPGLNGSIMVRKLERKLLQNFSSDWWVKRHNQENSESSKSPKKFSSRAKSSLVSEMAGGKHDTRSFGQHIAPVVPARFRRHGMADVKLKKASPPICPTPPAQAATELSLKSKKTFIDPQNPYSALDQDGDLE